MQRPCDHPSPVHNTALRLLDRWLTTPAELGRRLFVPRPEGLMRHHPGKQLHIMPELFFIEAGISRVELPRERYILNAGQICLMPRGMPHVETWELRRGRYRKLVIMLDAGRIRFHYRDFSPSTPAAERRPAGMTDTGATARIAADLDDLARLYHQPGPWARTARDGLLYAALARLAMAIMGAAGEAPRFSPRIMQAINLIANHLDDPRLGTTRLAAMVGCAPDYLSDRFRRETGISPTRYINQERLHKATYLLANSRMLIKEIAAACGIPSPQYFCRRFNRFTGMSPKTWRGRQ